MKYDANGDIGVRVNSEKIVLFSCNASISRGSSMKRSSYFRQYCSPPAKVDSSPDAHMADTNDSSLHDSLSPRSLVVLLAIALLTSALATAGCRMQSESESESAQGGDELEAPTAQFELPKRLKEISGLAVDDRGRLFAHDDESGIVYQLDPMTGKIVKSFRLGRTLVTEDFEGIAIAG
ncbi:MAG: hypothetical protein C0600_06030 [Ignavibacteria bacterium]|nr:MAG: hypothetical protein C0600_06030 [Ignavibacteria bacterium]